MKFNEVCVFYEIHRGLSEFFLSLLILELLRHHDITQFLKSVLIVYLKSTFMNCSRYQLSPYLRFQDEILT